MAKLTTKDVSERLSVPLTTIKSWADRLAIGDRNSLGQRMFDDADLSNFAIVKALRDEDSGFETITRRIQPMGVGERQESADERRPATDAHLDILTERITAAVVSVTKADNELAEKYARSAHRIGELEAEVRHLTDDRARLLTVGQDQVATLRAELAAERGKSWWRKMLGQ